MYELLRILFNYLNSNSQYSILLMYTYNKGLKTAKQFSYLINLINYVCK